MIKLMFRCIGKTSKVSAKGTTWTITFIRDVGGPVLVTKLATMNPDLAALYQEDKNYPITIKEDYDLEGLFATVPAPTSSPDPAPAPEQTEPPAPATVDPETGEVVVTERAAENPARESEAALFRHMACTSPDETGRDPEMDARENVRWIFNCSVGDPNWEAHKRYLSDEELLYCIKHFRGKSGLAKLRAEAHRRGLAIPGEEQSPRRRGRPPGSKNKFKAPRPEPEPESDPEPGPEMDPEPESEPTMRNGPGF